MSNLAPETFYRRNLPHVQPPGATFFVTFRLAGSIPETVLAELQAEAKRLLASWKREAGSAEHSKRKYRDQLRFFGKWDAALDLALGPDWLRDARVAQLVAEAMHHFAGIRYELLSYCIMPNHVHVVFAPRLRTESTYYALAQIMHTMKGYSAGQANRVLGRSGAFWQHESYDHCVRNPGELERIVEYVRNNPVKAGLVADWQEWPWTYDAQNRGLQSGRLQ